MMTGARWNVDNNYRIIVAVITYLEGNVTCMVVQYKKKSGFTRFLRCGGQSTAGLH
jgi:hypothetical protein